MPSEAAAPAHVRLVAFHGTSSVFDAFDDEFIGTGTATEPNNRLGFYLTPDVTEALDYALCAAGGDEEQASVLAVTFTGRLGPALSVPITNFVEGDLYDRHDGHEVIAAFATAYAEHGMRMDPCEAFSDLRISLMSRYDALWIDTGETAMLCVLNPSALEISRTMTTREAKVLGDHIEDREAAGEYGLFGDEAGDVAASLLALSTVLASTPKISVKVPRPPA